MRSALGAVRLRLGCAGGATLHCVCSYWHLVGDRPHWPRLLPRRCRHDAAARAGRADRGLPRLHVGDHGRVLLRQRSLALLVDRLEVAELVAGAAHVHG